MSRRPTPAAPPLPAAPTLRFRAPVTIEEGAFPFLAVPARVSRAFAPWAIAGRIAVSGTIGPAPFDLTLLPAGGGRHRLSLSTALRRAAGIAQHDLATVVLTARPADQIIVPDDLAAALVAAAAQATFDALTVSHRSQLLRQIRSATTPAARTRAVVRVVDQTLGRAAPAPLVSRRSSAKCPLCGAPDTPEHMCEPPDLDAAFDGTPAPLMKLFTRLHAMVEDCGPVAVTAATRGMYFVAERRFISVTPRRAWLELGLSHSSRIEHPRVRRVDSLSWNHHIHRLRLAAPADLDAQLRDWIWLAYQFGGG